MLTLQRVTYTHSNKDILLADLDMVFNPCEKIALIGNNDQPTSNLDIQHRNNNRSR